MITTPQEAKQRLYLMRNGIVADALRPAMPRWRVIYGLNIPQIKEIAADCEPSATLARALLADTGVREAPLLGAMVMPVDALTLDEAVALLEAAPTNEQVDVLCHSLLRRRHDAPDIALAAEARGLDYASLRLMLNLLAIAPLPATSGAATGSALEPTAIREIAAAMAERHPSHPLARRISSELEF